MKPSPEVIRFDQRWLHEKRRAEEREEARDIAILLFFIALVLAGAVFMNIVLAEVARSPI